MVKWIFAFWIPPWRMESRKGKCPEREENRFSNVEVPKEFLMKTHG